VNRTCPGDNALSLLRFDSSVRWGIIKKARHDREGILLWKSTSEPRPVYAWNALVRNWRL